MESSSVENLLALAKRQFLSGRTAETESLCQEILFKNPANSDALHLLGLAAHQAGRQDEALALLRRAVAANPGAAHFQSNLGAVLTTMGRVDEAIAAYQRAIALQPRVAETYNNLGNVLAVAGNLDEAIAACRKALELQPKFISAFNNLGTALLNNGQAEEGMATFRRGMELDPADAALHSNLIVAMQYSLDDAAARAEANRWDERHALPLRGSLRPHENGRDPNRRLRIGYVSADFREHASAFFLMPLLGNHDRREFEITCYANVPAPDATTERFVSLVDRWRNIVGVSDEQVAVDVRADQIDILVDLKLHTSDNRLLIFARKPAPIQVSWLGYPGSSGLKTIDYRLTDSYLEPAGGANLFADHPYRLPDCFWCYDPLEDRPAVNSLPAIAAGYVTFGSLNNFFKVTDATLDLWAKVLLENADSRLLLLAPAGSARERTLEKLSRRGVDSGRVEFVARQSRQEYLRTYHRIDVCLDTIPYNGHTTSLDALFMGVPVLTRVGNSPVGRGGWTQLSNLGLQELAALDDGEFVRLAAGLAGDLPRLEKLRGILRGRMEESRLMDGPRFARGVEAAYRDVWQLYCKSGL